MYDKKKEYARVNRYKRKSMKRIGLELQKNYFTEVLEPAIKESGETTNGYIKKAIAMRLGLSDEEVQKKIAAGIHAKALEESETNRTDDFE